MAGPCGMQGAYTSTRGPLYSSRLFLIAICIFALPCDISDAKDAFFLGATPGAQKTGKPMLEQMYDLAGPHPAHSMKELDEFVRLHPKSPEGYLPRGRAYLMDGDPESAVKEFNKALAVDPKFAPAHIGLSRAMQGMGN